MKKIITLILILMGIKSYATCIVIIRTDSEIYVGADSKRTFYAKDLNTREVYTSTDTGYCKIHKYGNFYFAIAGWDDTSQHEYAKRACLESKSLNELADNYSKTMIPAFEKSKSLWGKLNDKDTADNYVADIAFFYFNKGKPELITLCFKIISKAGEKIKIGVFKTENASTTFMGIHDNIDKLKVHQLEEIVQNIGFVNMIEGLIGIEIGFHHDSIGSPINILMLNFEGETWFPSKNNCNY